MINLSLKTRPDAEIEPTVRLSAAAAGAPTQFNAQVAASSAGATPRSQGTTELRDRPAAASAGVGVVAADCFGNCNAHVTDASRHVARVAYFIIASDAIVERARLQERRAEGVYMY